MKHIKSFKESISDRFSKERNIYLSSLVDKITNEINDCVLYLSDISDMDNMHNLYRDDLSFTYWFDFNESQSREDILEALWESIEKLKLMVDAKITAVVIENDEYKRESLDEKNLNYKKLSKYLLSKKLSKGKLKIRMEIE